MGWSLKNTVRAGGVWNRSRMVKPSQNLKWMVRLRCRVKDRRGTIVRINKLMRGFGAGTGVRLEVAMDSSWDWMEFWIINSMVLFFLLHKYTLWITGVCSTVDL